MANRRVATGTFYYASFLKRLRIWFWFFKCSVTCGERHTTTRQVTCVAPSTENVLEWSYCDPGKRPLGEKECNIPACNVQQTSNDIETDFSQSGWRVGDWGQVN